MKPSYFQCLVCSGKSTFFCDEFPPKMCGCNHCGSVMALMRYDPISKKSIYTTVSHRRK